MAFFCVTKQTKKRKTTVKYELWRSECELGFSKYVGGRGKYEIGDVKNKDSYPKLIDSFLSEEEALKALANYNCDLWCTKRIGTLLNGREYYIVEAEYDENYELICNNILKFAKLSESAKQIMSKESQTFEIISVVEDTDLGGIRIEFLLIKDIGEEYHEIVAQLPKDENGYRGMLFAVEGIYKRWVDGKEDNIPKSDFDSIFLDNIIKEAVRIINFS